MTRYYLDTEFLDDGTRLELISIALVCEDGRELYYVNSDFDRSLADEWLNANVMPQLPQCACPGTGTLDHLGHTNPDCLWRTRKEIAAAIEKFITVEDKEQIEIWAYFASYDWVLFCQCFGKMIDLPKHFPWLVNDLKTWAKHMGYTGKFRDLLPDVGHHIALEDARWNRDVHKLLIDHITNERDQLRSTLFALDARLQSLAQSLVVAVEGAHEPTPIQTIEHLVSELVRDYESTKGQLHDMQLQLAERGIQPV